MKKKQILAITPTRGNSKGLPNKNLKLLGGKPTIKYTLEAVHNSKYKEQICHVVSSNSFEILNYVAADTHAVQHPNCLSEDGKSAFGVVKYITEMFVNKGHSFDLVLLLRATSPLRNSSDINNSLDLFQEKVKESYSSIVGYTYLNSPHPQRMRTFDGKKLGNLYQEQEHSLRQALSPKLLVRNEAIYVTTPNLILNNNSLWGIILFLILCPQNVLLTSIQFMIFSWQKQL